VSGQQDSTYDCVVIGAGIAGTTTALVLAQVGLRVLTIEAGSHPRFAIGESLVPTTTLGFHYLAKTYRIPELRRISHYPDLKELGCAAWPKLGFWFGHHRAGETLQPGSELMFVSPGLPIGPDTHLLRADVDGFLASRLTAYGVDYLEHAAVADLAAESDHVALLIDVEGRRRAVRTRFVLDCSGHKSFLAERFGLRETLPRLRTNTRTIFSHFRDVPFLEDVLPRRAVRFRASRDACTIHHCFDGGWFWVIRFDNRITSVGLVLDREIHPDNDQPAEEEFRRFVGRFPSVEAQLGSAAAIRPFVKTSRVQFLSHRISGDRYLLAPHAAGFVDPLFSTGIDLTVAFVARMAPILRRLMDDDDFRAERWAPLEQCFFAEIEAIDRVVHGMYRSYRHMDLFKQYWRCWIYVSLLQYFTQFAYDPAGDKGILSHFGASLPGWRAQLERMYRCVVEDEIPESAAAKLKSLMDGFPEPFAQEEANWAIGSIEPCSPVFDPSRSPEPWFRRLLADEPALAARATPNRLGQMGQILQAARTELQEHYLRSKTEGTVYHRGIDFILAQQS
jgi:FADH2 O2-dependent halogenase